MEKQQSERETPILGFDYYGRVSSESVSSKGSQRAVKLEGLATRTIILQKGKLGHDRAQRGNRSLAFHHEVIVGPFFPLSPLPFSGPSCFSVQVLIILQTGTGL